MKSRAPLHKGKMTDHRSAPAPTAVASRWPAGALPVRPEAGRGTRAIDDLRDLSRRGLWNLQLFLLLSCAAFLVRDFDLYSAFPEEVLQILGCAPPEQLIMIALAGYVFTVVTPLLIHMHNGDKPAVTGWHLVYRSIFYLFFLSAGALTANFMLVFVTGLGLYLLEQTSVGVAFYRLTHGDRQPA